MPPSRLRRDWFRAALQKAKMERERWKQVEQLCHAALEREESERAAFLKGACAGDEALRREVESLLAHEKQAEKFMEAPALDVAVKALAQDQDQSRRSSETDCGLIGKPVSHYRILEKLGGWRDGGGV